jgi:diaminopropionate ammonia-lyase
MKVPCVIFLPAGAAPERIANIRGEGARVVMVDGAYEDAVRTCDEESRTHGWQVVSDVGYDGYMEIPPIVVEGYSTLYQEIDEQLLRQAAPAPGVVLVPGGVGGILHAAVDHLRRDGSGPALIGVEPLEADCLTASLASAEGRPATSDGSGRTGMACLNCAEVSLPSWPPIRAGVDAMLAIDDGFAEDGVRLLYHAEGGDLPLEAGTSGAATTGGLLALVASDEGRSIHGAILSVDRGITAG